MTPKHQIEYRKLSGLKKLPNNPRTIKHEDMEKLKTSLQNNADYFEARPLILSNRTGELIIIAGNQRYEAAKALKMAEVPTVLLEDLTEEREREIIIRDNVSNGEWDMDILANEWDAADLEDWGVDLEWIEKNEDEVIEDEPPEVEEDEPSESQPGEIYQLGDHYLMCGDSTDPAQVQKLMRGGKADMLLTDPPYNVAISNSQGMTIANDNMESNEFRQFLSKAFACATSALKPGGAFYVWYASRTHIAFEESLCDNGLEVRQQIIWVKNALVLGRQDYQWRHEPCLYGWKEGGTHYFVDDRSQSTVISDDLDIDKLKKDEAITLLKQIFDGTSTTVINEAKPTINDLHPTMKPIALLARLVKNSTKHGEHVLDLFGGSGSTLITCEQLGRTCYMMEYDPKYCDVIRKRYWKFVTGSEEGWQNGTRTAK